MKKINVVLAVDEKEFEKDSQVIHYNDYTLIFPDKTTIHITPKDYDKKAMKIAVLYQNEK